MGEVAERIMNALKSTFCPPSLSVFHNKIKPRQFNETVSVRFSKEGKVDEWVRIKMFSTVAPQQEGCRFDAGPGASQWDSLCVCEDSLQILHFAHFAHQANWELTSLVTCPCRHFVFAQQQQTSTTMSAVVLFLCAGTCLCTVCVRPW